MHLIHECNMTTFLKSDVHVHSWTHQSNTSTSYHQIASYLLVVPFSKLTHHYIRVPTHNSLHIITLFYLFSLVAPSSTSIFAIQIPNQLSLSFSAIPTSNTFSTSLTYRDQIVTCFHCLSLSHHRSRNNNFSNPMQQQPFHISIRFIHLTRPLPPDRFVSFN